MTASVFEGPVMEETETEEVLSGGLAVLDSAASMSVAERASIDSQVSTAKAYPRSVAKAMTDAKTLATMDEETAASMMYTLERGQGRNKKLIPGPSVRLAEVMVSAWGNMRVDADIVGIDDKFVTAMGTCFDMEKNIAVRVRVTRRITDKNGRRYGDDMIGVTSMAAISIAYRNAVLKVIPRALTDRIYREAIAVARGSGKSMEERRKLALAWWENTHGVKPAEIFAALGVKGIDDIGDEQIIILLGFRNSIKEGEMTVASVFRPGEGERSGGASELNQAIPKPAATPQAAPAAVVDEAEDIRRQDEETARADAAKENAK